MWQKMRVREEKKREGQNDVESHNLKVEVLGIAYLITCDLETKFQISKAEMFQIAYLTT